MNFLGDNVLQCQKFGHVCILFEVSLMKTLRYIWWTARILFGDLQVSGDPTLRLWFCFLTFEFMENTESIRLDSAVTLFKKAKEKGKLWNNLF